MPEVKCANPACGHVWELGTASTNRCPKCDWITEIYYDKQKAEQVAEVYNDQSPVLIQPAGVLPLIGINGYSVSFPDQGRLAEIADRLLRECSE